MFSLGVSVYQDTDAREKNNVCLVEHLSTSAVFPIAISMQELKLVVVEN